MNGKNDDLTTLLRTLIRDEVRSALEDHFGRAGDPRTSSQVGGRPAPKPRAYSPAQFAEILRVPEKTVTQLLREGRIYGTKVGRLWVIPDSSLEDILAKRQ